MIHQTFTQMAAGSLGRYVDFTAGLRRQIELGLRRGPLDSAVRADATQASLKSAKNFLRMEDMLMERDSQAILEAAVNRANKDLGVNDDPTRLEEFVWEANDYSLRLIAAQVERDTVFVAQELRNYAQRVDLYVRSGLHTQSSAAASVMLETKTSPNFQFVDRIGRRYKSTKHIRDIYRQHLLMVYNEVYVDVVSAHGVETVTVYHPEPNYKWNGQKLSLVGTNSKFPLYYDLRDEIFHPSSNATLTIG